MAEECLNRSGSISDPALIGLVVDGDGAGPHVRKAGARSISPGSFLARLNTP
jgi:hypothetical protein